MYDETSVSWLHSLKKAGPTESAWTHFVQTYEPFIKRVLKGQGLQEATIADVTQNVMLVVVQRLPEFERERTGSFRSWLRAITVNCLRNYRRSKHFLTGDDKLQELIGELKDNESELSRAWNQQHAEHVLNVLLESIESEFEPVTIQIFRSLAIDSTPVADVAAKHNKSKGACYVARSKVLKRMREILTEHFPDDERLIDFR